jgi:crotonobetainyl-CoA:carnitine CoA-transferase CaiB-like acyl-CoA transferase
MTTPLAGLNVIEYADSVASRYCGRLFAAHGANVVQIGIPDVAAAGYGGAASKAYAAWLDSGKRGAADFDAASRACGGKIDLVITGLDAATITVADQAIEGGGHKHAVRVGMTWFAPDGPYAKWIGSDAIIQAMSAVAYVTGAKDGMPMLPRGHAPQVVTGATAYIAALGAIIGRDAGWRGRRIDLNVLDANLCFSESGAAAVALTGDRSVRRGVNRFTPTFPGGIYQASDGWIGVTALTAPQWISLCDMIGRPDLGKNRELWVALQRMERADELDQVLVPAFKTKSAKYLLKEGQRRRIPLAPVPSLADLPRSPHWQERGSFGPVIGHQGAVGPTMPFHIEPLAPTAAPKSAAFAPDLPLSGVRVLDLSMGWAGPLAGRHFADLGAEVVKVESCTHFDWWRAFDGPLDGDPPPYETKPSFLMVNRNKHGITLDLKAEAGKALVRKLAVKSDVMIENYAPGVLDKLGVGAREMVRVKPDLVCVGMGAFGAKGPWRSFRAYGSTVEQASGLPFANGEPADPPTMQHVAYGDPIAGIYGAIAALTALYGRNKNGGGAIIDLGQVECLFQLGADAIVAQSVQSEPLKREGSRHPLSALRVVSPSNADKRWFAVAVETLVQWNALARAIGRNDLVAEKTDLATLKRQELAMEAAVQSWGAQRSAAEACAALQAAGVSAGPVYASVDLLDDPQLKQSGFWRRADRKYIGNHVIPHAPYLLDGKRLPLRNSSPTLGEHNTLVLRDDLGLSQRELDQLSADGVIGTRAVAEAAK